MKKLASILIIVIVVQCFLGITAGYTDTVDKTLYSLDGRELSVRSDEVAAYCQLGWYTEPVMTVYSTDYRQLIIKKSELEAYKNVGWYEDPVMIVYAEDGRELVIKISDMEAYMAVGWYTEPVVKLYARDGRSIVVASYLLDAYKKVGWYDDVELISSLMIAPDNSTVRVFADNYAYYYTLGYRFKGRDIDPSKPMVALTFDDGPSIYTPQILNCLEAYGARATFFCVGQSVRQYPRTVKRAFELGMEIGNHTYNHPDLVKLSDSSLAYQLSSTSSAIYDAAGIYPTVVRPPYGSVNARVKSMIGYPIILWSIDTLDWKTRNANSTYNSVISNVKDGDIILMHDLHGPTATAVDMIVPKLHKAGYQMVTVSELAKYKNITLKAGVSYSSIR